MENMSEKACTLYRKVVYNTPDFVDYFRMCTPEPEFSYLNIGSRVRLKNYFFFFYFYFIFIFCYFFV